MKPILILSALAALSGCSTLNQELNSISGIEFESLHRASPYSEIWVQGNEDGSKDIRYTYKLGPFYNASATIEGLKVHRKDAE